MKLPLILVIATGVVAALPAAPKFEKVWETDAVLKVPEGVVFDASRKVLYVSNIDGKEPWGKDGAGSIARVGLDGKVRDVEWVTGLDAPKGMALANDRLYVADINRVVAIDPDAGKIVATIPVPDAQRLNDVSADRSGAVYVTDSGTGNVFVLRDDKPTLFSDAFKGPNGVLATPQAVYVLDQETLFEVQRGQKPVPVVRGLAGHVDGVEVVGTDAFVVSCWNGIVYHATRDGTITTLLDTREEKVNAADIGYDPDRRIVYVPTFWNNTVVAYQLSGDTR